MNRSTKRLCFSFYRLGLVFLMVLLSGCALDRSRTEPPPPTLNSLIDDAAQRMLADYPELTRFTPMIAATFVDIDYLQRSSTFGRMSSELFASALSRSGMQVREVKMRDSLFIEESIGELILSREVQRLMSTHDARSILMGTYAAGQHSLYVSVRVVRASDAMVLGTADLHIPMDNNLRTLLGSGFY